jgi:hypothetical protein
VSIGVRTARSSDTVKLTDDGLGGWHEGGKVASVASRGYAVVGMSRGLGGGGLKRARWLGQPRRSTTAVGIVYMGRVGKKDWGFI